MRVEEKKIKRMDKWAERLMEQSISHENDYAKIDPTADGAMVREAFLLQKMAVLIVLLEDLSERLHRIENKVLKPEELAEIRALDIPTPKR